MRILGIALFALGLFASSLAWSEDVSALQTAVHIAQGELERAQKERDTFNRRVAEEEKELAELKAQLEADRKKAAEAATRYLESKKKYDKAQAALEKAWKK